MSPLSPSLYQWLTDQLPGEAFTLKALAGDASFRRYYRVGLANRSLILMVVPPDKEKTSEFIQIAQALAPLGLRVPDIYAYEPQQGLALLSDLGDTLLLDVLEPETVTPLYSQAMKSLLVLQKSAHPVLPFDEAHTRLELSYFPDWCLAQLLDMDLSKAVTQMLDSTNALLVNNILEQPQVFVHRDYHSRNLMVLPQGELGIIDFQDAMKGPITYDLVSLLKDCYITWPGSSVREWAYQYWEMLNPPKVDFNVFHQWFDLTGLQRHIKVLGIFSRLKIRDNKPHYIQDMPRILNYVLDVTSQYPALADFHDFCGNELANALQAYFKQHALNADTAIKVA